MELLISLPLLPGAIGALSTLGGDKRLPPVGLGPSPAATFVQRHIFTAR